MTTRTPTATLSKQGSQLDHKGNNGSTGSNPHKDKHLAAELRLDVDLCLADKDMLKDDEHGGCNDGGDHGEEARQEGQDGKREGAEEDEGHTTMARMSRVVVIILSTGCSRGYGPRGEKDHDEGQHGGRDEAAEHPVGGCFCETEGIVDVGWEGDYNQRY